MVHGHLFYLAFVVIEYAEFLVPRMSVNIYQVYLFK